MCSRVEDRNSSFVRSSDSRDLSGASPLAEVVPVLAMSGAMEDAMSGTNPNSAPHSGSPERPLYGSRFSLTSLGGPKRFAITQGIFLLTFAFLLCVQAFALTRYREDRRYLTALASRVIDSSAPPSEQTKQILTYFKGKPRKTNMSYFMFPFLDFLRPTARQVAEQGGDCADRSRLALILLQVHGVSAEKWTLYSKEGRAKHSIIEVNTEQGKMAADPLFGLFFPKASGGYYSVAELRSQPDLVGQRVLEMENEHQEPLAAQIERYPVNANTYAFAKTMNWSKSAVTRLLYRVLRSTLGKQADDLRRPVWPEEPALVVTFGIGFLQVLLLFGLVMVRRAAVKHSEPLRQEARMMSSSAASSLPA